MYFPKDPAHAPDPGPKADPEISSSIVEFIIRALAERGIFAFRWDQASLPPFQLTCDTAQVQ